jgi:hypothetical protein
MLSVARSVRGSPYYVVLLVWGMCCFFLMILPGGRSWHFFVTAASLLTDVDDPVRGGLHLYAAAPELQIGPVAILGAVALLPLGPSMAQFGWQVLGAAIGFVILHQIQTLARQARPDLSRHELDVRLCVTAAFVLPVWMYLAVGSEHIDDVLALLFCLLALRAAQAQRAWAAGALLGLAVDAKPWALGLAGVLLLVGDRTHLRSAATAAAIVIAAAWAPFLIADPATTHALRFTIANTPMSGLRALGVDDARTPPWDRPAQLLLGLGLAVLAWSRGHWPAVVLIGVAARLVLEPGSNLYYQAGLVLGAAIWDLAGARSRFPWWTVTACLLLFASRALPLPSWTFGWLQLAYFLACCLLILLPGRRSQADTFKVVDMARVGDPR